MTFPSRPARTVGRARFALLAFCALMLAPSLAAAALNMPPSAQLEYSIRAKQSGLALSGRATIQWQVDHARYLVIGETSAMLVGKILDERSEGSVDAHGLQPSSYTEKRFRKPASVTSFDRAAGNVRFGRSQKLEKLQVGEQDRASALWQLIATLRSEKKAPKLGMSWRFPVAGQEDSDPWTFVFQGRERLKTSLGELDTLHLVRQQSHPNDRRLDIWLAPGMEWYPVRLRFEDDGNNEYIEQFLEGIKRQ
jgi:hypothetical protein